MRISLASATRRVSAVLTVSLALGLTVGCHRDPNKQKQRYLESGKRYADQGKLTEARIQFTNALKVDHNFADAHYQLSKVLIKQGSMLPAYGELLRTVDLQPANLPARIDLGNILVAGKQPAKADRAGQRSPRHRPEQRRCPRPALQRCRRQWRPCRGPRANPEGPGHRPQPRQLSRLSRLSTELRSRDLSRGRRPAPQGCVAR